MRLALPYCKYLTAVGSVSLLSSDCPANTAASPDSLIVQPRDSLPAGVELLFMCSRRVKQEVELQTM